VHEAPVRRSANRNAEEPESRTYDRHVGLHVSVEDFRRIGHEVVERLARYYANRTSQSITPTGSASSLREAVPHQGADPMVLLDTIEHVVFPASRHNGHPRFFGYVASPGTPITAIGDFVTSALNANVTSWRSGPAATEIEHTAIAWIKQMVGYPADAGGLFVSGGSMANFSGLAAARSAVFPDATAKGVHVPVRIYASDQVHFSIPKAAAMLGLGSDSVRLVPTDESYKLDPFALERAIEEDRAAGLTPMAVVASAGTVATGAIDPILAISEVARRHELWLHVDGAYGGLAAIAPTAKQALAHLNLADSIALDPHKWLYVPASCGCILYRNPEHARRAFAHDADYTRPIGLVDEEAFAFWDYGPELSRRFRALDVWLQIKSAGVDAIAEAIESNILCARYFEQLVRASGDVEMLAPVELSIFCFRCRPREYSGDLDELNERVMLELQRQGGSYVSNARLRGRFALRGCVLNYQTTRADMERLLEDIRRAFDTLS
jgi:aromatic-L-amino-acid/L-tryptophan decarboxylase